jgi:hypothetical protein
MTFRTASKQRTFEVSCSVINSGVDGSRFPRCRSGIGIAYSETGKTAGSAHRGLPNQCHGGIYSPPVASGPDRKRPFRSSASATTSIDSPSPRSGVQAPSTNIPRPIKPARQAQVSVCTRRSAMIRQLESRSFASAHAPRQAKTGSRRGPRPGSSPYPLVPS